MCHFSPRNGRLLDFLDTVIESPRLHLTHTSEDDADNIFEAFDAAVTRYMFPKPAQSITETLKFITESRAATAAGKNLQLTISLKAIGEFLGCCGLRTVTTRLVSLKSASGQNGRLTVTATGEKPYSPSLTGRSRPLTSRTLFTLRP